MASVRCHRAGNDRVAAEPRGLGMHAKPNKPCTGPGLALLAPAGDRRRSAG